jgi:hypothetical protein
MSSSARLRLLALIGRGLDSDSLSLRRFRPDAEGFATTTCPKGCGVDVPLGPYCGVPGSPDEGATDTNFAIFLNVISGAFDADISSCAATE